MPKCKARMLMEHPNRFGRSIPHHKHFNTGSEASNHTRMHYLSHPPLA